MIVVNTISGMDIPQREISETMSHWELLFKERGCPTGSKFFPSRVARFLKVSNFLSAKDVSFCSVTANSQVCPFSIIYRVPDELNTIFNLFHENTYSWFLLELSLKVQYLI